MTQPFQFKLVLMGTIQGENQQEVVEKVKSGLSLALPLHDSIDDLVIEVTGQMDELQGRFG